LLLLLLLHTSTEIRSYFWFGELLVIASIYVLLLLLLGCRGRGYYYYCNRHLSYTVVITIISVYNSLSIGGGLEKRDTQFHCKKKPWSYVLSRPLYLIHHLLVLVYLYIIEIVFNIILVLILVYISEEIKYEQYIRINYE